MRASSVDSAPSFRLREAKETEADDPIPRMRGLAAVPKVWVKFNGFDCQFMGHIILSTPECMAGTTGLEPATSAVTVLTIAVSY